MEIIAVDAAGNISAKVLKQYGGAFTWKAALQMRGVGSPKVIYQAGVAAFDALNAFNENELLFANFEILPQGLLIRINKSQLLKAGILPKKALLQIVLTGFQVALRYRSFAGIVKTKIVHKGILEIDGQDGQTVRFEVPVSVFKATLQFFQKDFFQDSFTYVESENPPLVDETQVWLDNLLGRWF
ncbi:MAG: hypothetical protein ACK4TA_00055 [Saprospiraceae bacterium]